MPTVTLTRDIILDKIKVLLLNKVFQPESITEQSTLNDTLDLDSLDILELSMECEKEFDINVKDEDVARLVTVGDLVNLILKN